jgi:hypothetical protein
MYLYGPQQVTQLIRIMSNETNVISLNIFTFFVRTCQKKKKNFSIYLDVKWFLENDFHIF